MLTGRRAFQSDSKLSTLAAIIHKEPDPLPADLPHDLAKPVARCLRKDPERRFQLMKDLKVELEELKEESDSGALAGATPLPRKRRRSLVWAAAASGLAVLAGVALGVWLRRPRTEPPPTPFRLVPLRSYRGSEEFPTLSPDGNQVAFSWDGEKSDNTDVCIQPVGPGTPLRLTTHPERDVSPAWSPDGRWIAFVRTPRGKLQIILIPPLGGPERVLVDTDTRILATPSLAWTPDGKRLAGPCKGAAEEPSGMCLYSIESGEERRLTSPPANTLADTCPAISPDGRSLAFSRNRPGSANDLYVLRLTSALTAEGEPKRLTPESGSIDGATWTPDGRAIIYSRRDVLWRIAAAGSAKPEQLVFAGGDVTHPVISGARRRLVYSWGYEDTNIWRLELASPTRAASRSALISSSRQEDMPEYSPDGKRVLFHSDRSGRVEIWTCHSDGSNCVQVTSQEQRNRFDPRWSPDGKYIVFSSADAGQSYLYVVGAEGGKAQRLSTGASSDSRGSWSRDGRWIYFTSLRTGQHQVWKMPWTPGAGRESEAVQVTHKGGLFALESPDGRYVYYANSRTNAGLWRVPAQGARRSRSCPLSTPRARSPWPSGASTSSRHERPKARVGSSFWKSRPARPSSS